MKRWLAVGMMAALAVAGIGCKDDSVTLIDEPALNDKNYEAQLPPGQLALRKITDPAQVPDFTSALSDTAGLREAIAHSLSYLAKPSSQAFFPYGEITHQQAVASLKAFDALIATEMTPQQLNAAVRARFDTWISVGYADNGIVLFTGYYTPILPASRQRTEEFRYPLFKQPPGLVKREDGTPVNAMPDRKTIEQQNLYAGNELVWLANPFDAYIAHIQGSARLRMQDGSEITVGYTANNGHPYRSIRAELVKDNKIPKRAGLAAMRTYFKQHPEEIQPYTWQNPRYIFFTMIADGRPRGCLNEPVTAVRSIATDKSIYPRACLAFLSAPMPRAYEGGVSDEPYSGFALDQDAGGAIRAPGRCDFYLGIGTQAGELAGRIQNEGRLYYLFLKPVEMQNRSAAPQPTAAP